MSNSVLAFVVVLVSTAAYAGNSFLNLEPPHTLTAGPDTPTERWYHSGDVRVNTRPHAEPHNGPCGWIVGDNLDWRAATCSEVVDAITRMMVAAGAKP
jgi:hypothetical protein